MSEEPKNPNRFYCPFCGTENPPYGWNFNGGDLGIAGQVTYVTIYCGAVLQPKTADQEEKQCRRVLGVSLLGYQPGAELVRQAQQRLGLRS